MYRRILIALLCLGIVTFDVSSASASNRKSRVIAAGRKLKKDEAAFSKKFNKLSPAEQLKVKEALQGLLPDSDADGLPNIIESSEGSNICDDDSDDDGNSDDMEREAEGQISALSETSITVEGVVFSIDENTAFEDITKEALAVGICVEVEGALVGEANVASKIEASDDCDGEHKNHHED